jgi:transposase
MKKITNEEREKVRGVVVDVRRYHHRRRRPPPSRDRFSDRVSSLSPRASSISTVTKILKTTRRRINITRERERAALRIFGVDGVVVVILVVVRVALFVRASSSNHEFVL